MRHQVGASVSVLFLDEALDELRRYMPRRADRGHDRRRDRPDPLHVRHGQGAEGRRAHACVHVGAAGPGDALARRARGRRRLVHLGDGVGEGDLELAPRPVVARGGDRGARRIVRCPGAALPPAAARGHDPRPDSDGVPDARQAREAGVHASAPAPPRRIGRRAAQSRGHRAIPGCAGAHGARRLRPDRELPSHREHARRPHPARIHGPSDPGPRRGRDRRGGPGLPARRRGRPRADRPSADALRRLLGGARRDRRGLPGRLVPHGRSSDARRGRVLLVRRARGRRDRLGGVSHQPVRGRERAPRASGGRRERRRRRARPRPRPDREGVRRPPPGAGADRPPRHRAPGARQGGHRAVQLPA